MRSAQLIDAQIQAEKQIDFTLKKTSLFDRFRDQLNERQLKTLRRMLEEGPAGFEGGMSANKYMSITGASKATATRGLQDLADKGIFVTSDLTLVELTSAISHKIKHSIGFQLQQHRRLNSASAKLLREALHVSDYDTSTRKQFVKEGRKLTQLVSRRERKIRQHALEHHGTTCQICEFDFDKLYGEFAKECVEVHHLNPISRSTSNGSHTSLDQVIVACPNCHRAIHNWIDPSNWKAFRRRYHS